MSHMKNVCIYSPLLRDKRQVTGSLQVPGLKREAAIYWCVPFISNSIVYIFNLCLMTKHIQISPQILCQVNELCQSKDFPSCSTDKVTLLLTFWYSLAGIQQARDVSGKHLCMCTRVGFTPPAPPPALCMQYIWTRIVL